MIFTLAVLFSYLLSEFVQLSAVAVESISVLLITLAGIVILMGALGMKISQNLGSTIVGGLFGAVGYVCRTIVQAFGWIIRHTVQAIPRVYRWTRTTAVSMGASMVVARIIGVIIAILFVVVII